MILKRFRFAACLLVLGAPLCRAAAPAVDWDEFRRRLNAAAGQGQWSVVERSSLRALQEDSWPSNKDQIFYALAEAALRQNRWEDALASFEKARKFARRNSFISWSADIRSAECLIGLGRPEKADKILAATAERAPFQVLRNEAQIDKGYSFVLQGRDVEAQQVFQDLIQSYSYFRQDRRVAKGVAALLLKGGSPTQAVEFLSRARASQAAAENEEDPQEFLLEALAYRNTGNFTLENRDLQRLLRSPAASEPLKVEASYLLGESYRAQGLDDMARKVFAASRGDGADPATKARSEYSLGLVALAQDKPEEAMARAKSALTMIAADTRIPAEAALRGKAHYLIGVVALKGGNLREARAHLEAADRVPSLSLDARLRLIWLKIQGKEYDAAAQAATEFINRFQRGDQTAYALLLRGVSYQKAGNLDKAAEDYAHFLDKFPEHPAKEKVVYLLADAYLQMKKWAELVSFVGMALRNLPPQTTDWQAGALFSLAEGLFQLERYAEALDVYRQLASRFPPGRLSPVVFESMAVCQAKLGKYDDALASQKTALSYSKTYPNPEIIRYGVLNLSSLMFDQRRYDKALSYYDTFLKHFPKDPLVPEVLYQSAYALSRAGRDQEAAARWGFLAKNYPASPHAPQALLEIGRRQLKAGDMPAAQEALAKILERSPDAPEAKDATLLLGQSLFNQGEYEPASRHYEDFMRKYPDDERAREAAKLLESSVYQLALSKKNVDTFLSRFPHSVLAEDLYWEIGLKHWQKKNSAEALNSFQKLAMQFPDGEKTKRAFFLMGEIEFGRNNFKEAAAAFRSFLGGDSPDPKLVPKAMFHEGIVLFRQDLPEKAAEIFSALLKEHPDDPLARDAHYNLILSEQKAGKLKEAVDATRAFLKAYPQAPEADALHLQEGAMLKSLGRPTEAAGVLNMIGKRSAVAAEAYFALGQLYQEQGDYRKAYAAYTRLLPLRPRDGEQRISGIAQLAELTERIGDVPQSVKLYKEIVRYGRNPDWQQAARQKIIDLEAQAQGGVSK